MKYEYFLVILMYSYISFTTCYCNRSYDPLHIFKFPVLVVLPLCLFTGHVFI
jgi:hypothetical protein